MKRSVIASMLFLWLGLAVATEPLPIYEADAPVADRSEAQRLAATQQALTRVLIRVSGNTAIATLPKLAQALRNPNRFVEQYSYLRRDHPPQLWLHYRFSPSKISTLLQNCGQAIWSAERPQLLLLMALQQAGEAHVVGQQDTDRIPGVVNQISEQRGLAINLPMLDLLDLQDLTPARIKADDTAALSKIQQRYAADGLITAMLTEHAGRWQTRWQLHIDDLNQAWEINGDSLADTLSGGLNTIADALANHFAVMKLAANEANQTLLQVNNITNVVQYAKVLDYLQKLTTVSNVEVVSVEPDNVEFKLYLTGSVESLLSSLTLNTTLQPESLTNRWDHLRYRLTL